MTDETLELIARARQHTRETPQYPAPKLINELATELARFWANEKRLTHYYEELTDKQFNEIERLRKALDEAHAARIEAQNPGIDIDEVRAMQRNRYN